MSDPINDGGAAFPHPTEGSYANPEQGANWIPQIGMSMRDYVAAVSLQGLLANPGGPIQRNGTNGWNFVNCLEGDVCKLSFIIADAWIAARDGKEKSK